MPTPDTARLAEGGSHNPLQEEKGERGLVLCRPLVFFGGRLASDTKALADIHHNTRKSTN